MPTRTARGADDDSARKDQIRVLVVGGGCAGLSAAWQLAKLPGFRIDVYERGPRLGGKGASTRDEHGRVLEHGLHVWLGFYENAFRMMRECYAIVAQEGWGPDAARGRRLAHASFDAAFFAEEQIGVAGRNRAGHWEAWSGQLPPAPGAPGTPIDELSNPFSLPAYIAHALALVRALMTSVVGTADATGGGAPRPDERSTSDEETDLDVTGDGARSPRAVVERLAARLRGGTLVSASVLLQAIAIFEDWLRTVNFAPQVADSALAVVEAVTVQVRRQLASVLSVDEHVRWKMTVVDIVMTIIVGLYRDRVLFHKDGLDSLNRHDYRTWLRNHGAQPDAVDSPFMQGIYDLVFAYRDGDRGRPALAAGVALRGALRMFFGYRGSMFWRMASGMGDAVFAPLYKVLAQARRHDGGLASPVHFHFDHQLVGVDFERLGGRPPRVSHLHFQRTVAEPRGSVLDHFGAWPENPALRPLAKPSRVTKAADVDFDVVVMACGPDAFEQACQRGQGAILERIPAWKKMFDTQTNVGTRAAQLWFDAGLTDLGWLRGPAVVSALGAPYETWADMTQVLATEEAWRAARVRDGEETLQATSARSVAYLCGVDAPMPQGDLRSALESLLKGVIDEEGPPWPRDLWPRAFAGQGSALGRLVKADGRTSSETPGADLLAQQYLRRNLDGSERYTQSLPGTVEHRVSPLDRSVPNLTIAGDWTACGLDAGCIEAAVMSGMLAAHAVTGGTPALQAIVGFDHP